MANTVSDTPTGFALLCMGQHGPECNQGNPIHMTKEEYTDQMHKPNSPWKCPMCGGKAQWDDITYKLYINGALHE